MSTSFPRRIGLLLAAAITALAALAVAPASAQTDPSHLTGSVTCPAATLTAAGVHFTGTIGYGNNALGQPGGTVNRVTVTLAPKRGQQLPNGASLDTAPNAPTYKLDWTTPDLPWNGPYQATINAYGTASFNTAQTWSTTCDFALAVPPAPPTGVTATFDEASAKVHVAWNNNTEPDLISYGVERASGTGSPVPLGTVDAPTTTFTDSPQPGSWRYTVVAIRKGADTSAVASDDSQPASVTVAAPPTTTTAGSGTASGSPSATTGTSTSSGSGSTATSPSGSGARAGSIDLSNFASLLDSRKRTVTSKPAPEADPGFQQTLPFKPGDQPALSGSDGKELGPTSVTTVRRTKVVDNSQLRSRLIGVAGFLVFFVMFMQAWWVKGQVAVAGLDLDVVEPTPEAGEPAFDVAEEDRALPPLIASGVRSAPIEAPELDLPLTPTPRRARRAAARAER